MYSKCFSYFKYLPLNRTYNFMKVSPTSAVQDAKFASYADSDRQSQLDFAYYCQKHPDGHPNFLSNILFTDECMFRLNGRENPQNVQIQGKGWPSKGIHVPEHSSGVISWWWWCITKEKVIGPYWLEGGTVIAYSYKFMVSWKVLLTLSGLEREFGFQLDVAGPYLASSVHAYLEIKCDDNWIGGKKR